MEVLALERTLTELDHVRLLNLARRARVAGSPLAPSAIEQLLDVCATVPSRDVPADVVTMYSQVELRDLGTGRVSRLTLCYPADADPARGLVSVLSPAGAALLGRTAGSSVRWSSPTGDELAAEILAIPFQPEANGDYSR